MRVSSLFLTAVLVVSTSSAWAAPKYREVKKLKDPVLQKVLEASQDLKVKLGYDVEFKHQDRNTSLVMAAKSPDMDFKALAEAIPALETVYTTSEMEFSAEAIFARTLRDARLEGETMEALDERVNLSPLKSALEAMKEASDKNDYEVLAVTFEDWEAHTELFATVIYDVKNREALLIGFTSLSW